MPIYAYDEGYNKHEVASSVAFDALEELVDTKQASLNATQGEEQSDYNTLTYTGIYYMPVTATNKPSNTNYILLVAPIDNEGSAVLQVAYSVGGTLLYTRVYSSGVWSPWTKWVDNSAIQQLKIPKSYSGNEAPESTFGSDGDTFYLMANGGVSVTYVKLSGTWMETPSNRVFNGASAPDSTLGKNGDTYYLVSNNSIQATYVKLNDTWMEVTTNA